MIKIVDKNLFDSNANFLIHQTNCQGVMGSGVALQVANNFPHVEHEYMKYLRYCKKNNINPLGTAQYVPVDTWAMVMVNTMTNNDIMAYDSQYQYIVNLFGQDDFGMGKQQTNLKAMEKAFNDIYKKAKKINATVAMPYKIGSYRGGADWNVVYSMIQRVFGDGVDVEICRCNKG